MSGTYTSSKYLHTVYDSVFVGFDTFHSSALAPPSMSGVLFKAAPIDSKLTSCALNNVLKFVQYRNSSQYCPPKQEEHTLCTK